jgi:hypothetical protein
MRTELRDEILEHFRSLVAPSGRPLYVTRRLGSDALLVQRSRLFDSEPHEQPFLISVRPGPDALRLRDKAIVVAPAETAAH